MPAGSFFIVRKQRQGKPGQFHEEWYLRLRFPGGKEQLFNSGYDICPKCMDCADAAALRERADCKCRAKPKRVALLRLEAANDERMLGALTAVRMRREYPTIGQLITAYMAPGARILKTERMARRNVNELRRVVALGRDMWTTHKGGKGTTRGMKAGSRVPDAARIDELEMTVLDRDLVDAYYVACCGGEVDWNEPQEGNITINSTMAHARSLFSRKARYHKLKGLKFPPCLEEFLKAPYLPEEDSKPDPLTAEQFEEMLKKARTLREKQSELELVNLLLRQTGLRSSYVCAARRSWLVREGGVWQLEIRDRPEEEFRKKRGTRNQMIPLSRELAARLWRNARKGEQLILPAGTDHERRLLVNRQHNAWLKGIIGGKGETTQGNHRLRDTVASVLWSIDKPTAAQEALGHSSVDMTAKHYGKKIHVGEGMRRELAAWTAGG